MGSKTALFPVFLSHLTCFSGQSSLFDRALHAGSAAEVPGIGHSQRQSNVRLIRLYTKKSRRVVPDNLVVGKPSRFLSRPQSRQMNDWRHALIEFDDFPDEGSVGATRSTDLFQNGVRLLRLNASE